MKYVKIQKIWLSLSITQLMDLLVMFPIASCSQCSLGTPNAFQRIVKLGKEDIQANEKAAIVFGNSGDKAGSVIQLNDYIFQATITNELNHKVAKLGKGQ